MITAGALERARFPYRTPQLRPRKMASGLLGGLLDFCFHQLRRNEVIKMLHIFLAEDNGGDVLLVKKALEEHRILHKLHVVRDGEEALTAVAHMGEPGQLQCPDVMLLDLNLPKVGGPEVLTQFRKHPECAHTPVVVITSSDAPSDRARVAALGVARYFRKPSDLNEFMELGAVVKEVVSDAQGNQAESTGCKP